MFKKLNDAKTPAEMRAAIEEAQFDHPIIRMALTAARRDGLRAEDTYAMLAYYALQSLVNLQTAYAHLLAISPAPLPMPPEPAGPPQEKS